jgi:hypothetical protein
VNGLGFLSRYGQCTLGCRQLSFDGGESRWHHQAVALVDQEAGFVGELEVGLPFRIRHHGSALARAVGRILEHPQVDERVDVSALPIQIGQRGPEMTGLGASPCLA